MNNKLYKFICDDLNLNINNVQVIQKLNGLNNHCYKIKYINNYYFLRLSNNQRYFSFEKDIIFLAAKYNIGPRLLYFSIENGNMMTEWINGSMPTEEDFSSYNFINKLIPKLKILHSLKTDNYFNPFNDIKSNYNMCKKLNISLPSYIDKLLCELDEIQDYYINNLDIGLCHNDLNPSNIIFDNINLHIIDYEFSAMGDIFFDLATLSWMMNNKGKEDLLKAYFTTPKHYHFKKLSDYLFVVKLWNASWSLLKAEEANTSYDYRNGALMILKDLYHNTIKNI